MTGEHFTAYNGVRIPAPGFGTYKTTLELGRLPIERAIAEGYRHFDTASFYGNEKDLGCALRESGIPRSSFFVATQLWAADQRYDKALRALETSLKNLGTDYLDLYMIHWPRPQGPVSDPSDDSWKQLNRDTWRAMTRMYEEGVLRTVGVSNFLPHHIANIAEDGMLPMVDQLEFHPGYLQLEAVEYCHSRSIVVEGWSPLGRARMLDHPLLKELAEKYGVSSAQVCIRFALQMKVLPLPKASSAERIRENADTGSFELSSPDMERVKAMPLAGWSGEHPDRPKTKAVAW